MIINLSTALHKTAFLLVCLFLLNTGISNAQKFGHLNSAELLAETASWKSAEQQVAELQKSLESQYNAKLENYQTEIAALQKRYESGNISQAELETEQSRIVELEKSIAQFELDAQQQVLKQEQTILTPILDNAKKAIEQVATENGFTYIFDTSVTSAVIFAQDTEDIKALVKAKLQ